MELVHLAYSVELCRRAGGDSWKDCVEVNGKLHDLAVLVLGKQSMVLLEWGAWWVPVSVWTIWRREKPLTAARIQTSDCATPKLVTALTQRERERLML
jgi:hypothetical protein